MRRELVAARDLLRVGPPWRRPGPWWSIRLARESQARGALQKARELAPLISLHARRRPRVVVEIGTAAGGTFYTWCKVADPRAVIVSIDLPAGPFGGGYTVDHMSVLRGYAEPGQDAHFIRDDSHLQSTRDALVKILHGRPIEFLLIDGDHTYAGVKKDFEMYSPLVRAGCPIAFHDILPHHPDQHCEVDRLWAQLKPAHPHLEFIDPVRDSEGRQYGGIGILFYTGSPSL